MLPSLGGVSNFIKMEAGVFDGVKNFDKSPVLEESVTNEGQQLLDTFWQRCLDDCMNLNPNTDFKVQELPLARIKKIMKLDEDVKMISAEAPIIFAKACELFVAELTTRAWIHTEESKRRTLQKTDVAMAVSKYDMFDFLIDIVPRDEIKANSKGRPGSGNDQVQYLVQLPASALNGSNGAQPITLNLGGQQIVINTSDDSGISVSSGVQTQCEQQPVQSAGNSQNQHSQQVLQIPLNQIVYQNSQSDNTNGENNMSMNSHSHNPMHRLTTSDDVPVIIQGDGSTSYYTTTTTTHENINND